MTLHPITIETPDALYRRFVDSWRDLDGRDPATAPSLFYAVLEARDSLLETLGLVVSTHNVERLYDHAEASASLDAFLADVDAPWPADVWRDEHLLLAGMAAYFDFRAVTDPEARLYDLEAFLGVPHHPHNASAIAAWLEGVLPWPALRAALSTDPRFLNAAVV